MNKRTEHNYEKRMLSINECCDYVGLGKNSTRQLMKDIGAECRVGSRCLYDKHAIDTYFDSLTRAENHV